MAFGNRLLASIFARLGPSLREHAACLVERNFEQITYRRLARWGYRPSAIVDVGAYRGDWAQSARETFGPVSTLMIEGQEALIPDLTKRARAQVDMAVVHAVLGARKGAKVQFFEMGTGSSIFPEVSNVERHGSEQVTQRLDDVVAKWDRDVANAFLKVDVQGAELAVLSGGTEFLAKCSLVQLELAMLNYNKGAPLLPEVVDWMAERQWLPIEVSGFSRPRSRLVQIDMLFAPSGSELRPASFGF